MPKKPDMTPLTGAQRDMAATCVRMAVMLADKASRRRPRMADEYLSDAMISLVISAQSFRTDRIKFSTYAYNGTVRRLRNTDRNHRPRGFRSDNPASRIPKTVAISALPYFAEPHAYDPEPCEMIGFESLIADLPERGRRILSYKFIDEMSLTEIGRKFHVTRERARQEYEDALEALRLRYA